MAPLLLLLLHSSFFLPTNSHSTHHHKPPPPNLSRVYNNSVQLDDNGVSFFYTLSNSSISLAAKSSRKSNYLAVGFGDQMANSYTYVGWIERNSKCHVKSYFISGHEASSIHLTSEDLSNVRCQFSNGVISFELTRSLVPSCKGRIECENEIDLKKPLMVIWAMGNEWSHSGLTEKNKHFAMSDKPEPVFLLPELNKIENKLKKALFFHGFLMFVSFGVLFPGGILSARFLKRMNPHLWFKLHLYFQYTGFGIAISSVILAGIAIGGFDFVSFHVKFGIVALALLIFQPMNGFFRPKKSEFEEISSEKRLIWEYLHAITGRLCVLIGMIALFTGLKHFGETHDSEISERLIWGLVLWILICVSIVLYFELKELKIRRRENNFSGRNWELGDFDDEEIVDLLDSDVK
ncbi:hypothetical protein LUZ60_017141 [Juncus effusus]|nr:hypothetical protein LUZ60_017141 [Juncus effusus]